MQRRRLAQFGVEACVDAHCHCLAGLDDGPAGMAAALDLCRALAADGTTTVIAAPHQLGRYDGRNGPGDVRLAVSRLNASLLAEGVPIRAVPGAEVRIDERIGRLLEKGEVLTLADAGRHLLVELPGDAFIHPLALLRDVQSAGMTLILAHPERCPHLSWNPEAVLPWVESGLVLQVTAGSVVGSFGRQAQQACWGWLVSGAASLVASDAHDGVMRQPCMSQAMAFISSELGPAVARRVCLDNPLRILQGSELAPALAGGAVGGCS